MVLVCQNVSQYIAHKCVLPEVWALKWQLRTLVLELKITSSSHHSGPDNPAQLNYVQSVKSCLVLDTDHLPSLLRTQGIFFLNCRAVKGTVTIYILTLYFLIHNQKQVVGNNTVFETSQQAQGRLKKIKAWRGLEDCVMPLPRVSDTSHHFGQGEEGRRPGGVWNLR